MRRESVDAEFMMRGNEMRHKHRKPPKWLKLKRVPNPGKGKYGHRIIAVGEWKGLKRKYSLHATKGYRSEPVAHQS